MEYYSEWNNALYTNMDEPEDYHTKGSKSESERQMLDYII